MDLTRASRTPKFPDIFIERPVLAVVVSVAFVLVGLRAALSLPILQYPQIESSSLITTPLPDPWPNWMHTVAARACGRASCSEV